MSSSICYVIMFLQVAPSSPAAKFKIQPDDVIVKVSLHTSTEEVMMKNSCDFRE